MYNPRHTELPFAQWEKKKKRSEEIARRMVRINENPHEFHTKEFNRYTLPVLFQAMNMIRRDAGLQEFTKEQVEEWLSEATSVISTGRGGQCFLCGIRQEDHWADPQPCPEHPGKGGKE